MIEVGDTCRYRSVSMKYIECVKTVSEATRDESDRYAPEIATHLVHDASHLNGLMSYDPKELSRPTVFKTELQNFTASSISKLAAPMYRGYKRSHPILTFR